MIPNGVRSKIPFNTLPMIIFAFPCSLSISAPECPPSKPVIFRLNFCPFCKVLCTGIFECNDIPPAHPVRKCPSSSLSIFSILCPVIIERSISAAPSIPISSSTVIITSSFGCAISLDSKIASAYATAIPSSPPSVVPFAFTKSPSIKISRLSFVKSILQPFSFSQTISI